MGGRGPPSRVKNQAEFIRNLGTWQRWAEGHTLCRLCDKGHSFIDGAGAGAGLIYDL